MKKYLMMLAVLLLALCWSCSKENEEPPVDPDAPEYVNPWINPTDTFLVDGIAYFKGYALKAPDVIMTKITDLKNTVPWSGRLFSMSNYKENSIDFDFSGETCDPRADPVKYNQLLIKNVQARPRDRQLLYNPELAQMPTFMPWFKLGLDGIDNISITTEVDFNAEHPAGSSLNDMCTLTVRESMKPVLDLFKNWKPEYPSVEEYFANPLQTGEWLVPFLKQTNYTARVSEIDYSRTQMITDGCSIQVQGFPSQEGDYPVEVTVKFHRGETLVWRDTLRYRNF